MSRSSRIRSLFWTRKPHAPSLEDTKVSAQLVLRLPAEVCEHMIHICFDDKKLLTALSLVCRAWVRPTRIHLFSDITISLYGLRRGREHRLFKLMKSNLCTFIGTLEKLTIHEGPSQWQEKILQTLVERGAVLVSLEVFLQLDSTKLHPATISSVRSLTVKTRSASPTTIANYCHSFANIRHLNIHCSCYHGDPVPPSSTLPSKLKNISIHTLAKTEQNIVLQWIIDQQVHLEELGIHFVPSARDHEQLQAYFALNTLQHISLTIFDPALDGCEDFQLVDISRLNSLLSISLQIWKPISKISLLTSISLAIERAIAASPATLEMATIFPIHSWENLWQDIGFRMVKYGFDPASASLNRDATSRTFRRSNQFAMSDWEEGGVNSSVP